MTKDPHLIRVEQPLSAAHWLMQTHRVRHLPVVDDGRLVGILSLGDMHLMETIRDVSPAEVPVEDAMTPEVYKVSPSAPMAAVARHMAEYKIGSAVVVDEGRVVGLVTTTDVARLLATVLEANEGPASA